MSVEKHRNTAIRSLHKSKPRRDRHDEVTRQPHDQHGGGEAHQRAPAVLSVERFAHRTGMTKGLLSYRDRREKKRVETAKVLRSYQKTMKREGYEAGSGASRKRKQDSSTSTTSTTPSGSNTANRDDNGNGDIPKQLDSTEASQENQLQTKKARTSRFQKSIHESEKRQRQQEEFRQLAAERQDQKQQALRRRRHRHKLLTARTSKGQPVMHNIVQDILAKLQAENSVPSSRANGGGARNVETADRIIP